MSMIQGLIMVV